MKIITIILSALVAFSTASAAADFAPAASAGQQKSKKAKAEVKEVTFHVHLHCASCVNKIEENVAFEKGVKDLKVSLADQTVKLKYNPEKTSEENLKNAIEKLGYKVDGKCEPGHEHHHDHGHHHDHRHDDAHKH